MDTDRQFALSLCRGLIQVFRNVGIVFRLESSGPPTQITQSVCFADQDAAIAPHGNKLSSGE
jgi:hypothetical protein